MKLLSRAAQIALSCAQRVVVAHAKRGCCPAMPPHSTTLSQDQIRDLIRRSADNDVQNDKKQRDYTYVERQETRKLNGKGAGEVHRDRRPTT